MSGGVLVTGILLFHEDSIRQSVPHPGPTFVGPAQAERKIRPAGSEDLFERALEQPSSISEPVVVGASAFDAVLTREPRLRLAGLRLSQVVEAEVGRDVRLIVTAKQRARLRGVRPFRETRTPPFVVLRDRMKLREIEG